MLRLEVNYRYKGHKVPFVKTGLWNYYVELILHKLKDLYNDNMNEDIYKL
jgi:hypothetical protein